MCPRDSFGVVLRSVGLVTLAASLLYLYSALVVIVYPDTPKASTPLRYIVASVVTLGISLYLLRGAPHLVAFAYGAVSTEVTDARSTGLTICSFCGKSHTEVKKLIQGPGVYICDNCVTVCKNVLEKEFATSKPQSEKAEQ